MATQLQRQLAKIAANSTNQLNLKAQKAAHGKSLLFEAKVAVSQDFETLYQICVEGFQELCTLDRRFEPFFANIFSEQSKTEEREQMTAEENQELNTVLEDFLGLVGTRLLLKPAQKAVEWVIRRFRVHEYNTDCVILTFLPYHSTPLFLSLLSILPRAISPNFRFLYPSIQALQNPQFQTIVGAAKSTDGFFRSFNSYVLKVAKARHHSAVLLSFWAGVTTQAVEGRVSQAQSGRETINLQKKQDLLTLVVPVLIDAFSLPNVPDLIFGACMIVTVMAAKGRIADGELDSLMETVASGWTASTIDARITCLAILAQERESYGLSKDTTKRLLKCSDFVEQVALVSQRYRVDRLVLGYIMGCLKRAHRSKSDSGNLNGVAKLVQEDILTQPELRIVVKELLSTSRRIQEAGSSITPEQRSNLADLVTLLAESPKWGGLFNKMLARSSISRDDLELSLQTVIPLAIEANIEADGNMEMTDAPPTTSDFENAMATAADKTLEDPSFISNIDSPDFAFFGALYALALSSQKDINRFLALPALRSDGVHGAVPIISFLLRVLCSKYSPVARAAALRIVSDHLKATKSPNLDFQCIIPYLIVALSDKSTTVRKAAAECTTALSRQYKLLLSTESQNSKPRVLGKDVFYSSAQGAQWVSSTKGSSDFVRKLLLLDLEEYVLDSSNITTMLSAAIDGIDSSKKGLKAGVVKLGSESRTAIFASLASHAVRTPILQVKHQLLDILRRVGESGSKGRSQILLPALKHWIVSPAQNTSSTALLLSDVDLLFLRAVSPKEKKAFSVLKDIVTAHTPGLRSEVLPTAHQVLREIWPSLTSFDQKDVGLGLFECSQSDTGNAEASNLALETLRSLNLPTALLVALLEKLPNALQMTDQPPSAKRRRTSKSEMTRMTPVNQNDLASALRQYTLVLEIIDSSKPARHPELLKGLFHALGEIHHYRAQTESGMVYLQALTINSLLAIVDKLKDTKVSPGDKSVIRTDLLVECIRHTTNSQVQNAALLLVSCLAVWQPEVVLHSVMPIFTFMGSTILRQADDYSAHVIDQTVSHVVPPLVTSLRKKNKEVVRGAADLLLSFTAAFEHIPLHRRLGLFEHVTKTLGPKDCLFAIMAMIVDRYPTDNEARRFLVELVNIFEPTIDLQAIRQYVGLVTDIFKQRRTLSEAVLNLKDKSPEELESTANNLLQALAGLLDNPQLKSRLVASFHPDEPIANEQRITFSSLMQDAIVMTQFVHTQRPNISRASSQVLSHIFQILPTVDLIKSAQSLLEKDDDSIRRIVIHSIDSQVQSLKQHNAETTKAMLEFIPHVTSLVEKSTDVSLKRDAISCIDQIIERFGKKDTSFVIAAAQVVTGAEALRSSHETLRYTSMYCLVTIVEVLQDEFIPLVPQVLPVALDYLEGSLEESRDTVAKSSFTLVTSLVQHLPFLVTGEEYLDRALKLAQAASVSSVSGVTASKRSEFYKLVGRYIDASELFAAYNRSYTHCQLQQGYRAIVEYLDAIKFAITERSKATVVKNSSSLFELLLKAFDHRRLALEPDSMIDVSYTAEEISRLEDVYNDVSITMIMKLNDVTFRPFFARLVEWVTDLSSKYKSGKILRATTLYRFLTTLFERLKALVTSYSSYILELTVDLLSTTRAASREEIELLSAILSALEQSFIHDQDDFWQSPNHFSPIAVPLVEIFHVASSTLSTQLISTITALASATSAADQHKDLNAAILKLMQSDDKDVRLAAVRLEKGLTEQLGEEWLVMVPEMMPVLGEVLEDEDADVEREGRDRANIACVFPSDDRPPRWARSLVNEASASSSSAPGLNTQEVQRLTERLHNLESLVKELSSQLKESQPVNSSTGGSSSGNAPRDGHITDLGLEHQDITSEDRQFGRLVVQNVNHSRYVSSSFWSRINDELDGIRMDSPNTLEDEFESSEDEASAGRSPPTLELDRTPTERHAFLFGHNLAQPKPDYHHFHPLPSQIPFLLDLFADNVNFIFHVVHLPTLKNMIRELRGNLARLTPPNEALMFSIYYAAITSMEEDDNDSIEQVMSNFGSSKIDLNLKYRLGLENALAKADFLNAPNFVLVQALIIFLCLARRHDSPRFVWMMTGIVIRMAQYLGLQRDGSNFKQLSPYEVEMRRRVWWGVCMLDVRSSEDQGTELAIASGSFDTKLPLNINNEEISLDCQLLPVERTGLTDMSIGRCQAGLLQTVRKLMVLAAQDDAANVDVKSQMLSQIYEQYEEGFLQYLPKSGNIEYWVGVTIAKLVMAKMTLIVFLPVLFAPPSNDLSDELRAKLLVSAIEVAEYNHALNAEQECRKWRWIYQTYTHWHAIVYLMIEACRRPWCPMTERAYVVLHSAWLIPDQSSTDKNQRTWIPLRKLMTEVRKHREAELKRLRADPQAARLLETEYHQMLMPSSSSLLSTHPDESSSLLFQKIWRQLVTMSAESNSGAHMPGISSTSYSDSSSNTAALGASIDTNSSATPYRPYINGPPPLHPVPTTQQSGPYTTSYDHSTSASNQFADALEIPPSISADWSGAGSTGLGGVPWLWADTDPIANISPSLDMDMELDGEFDCHHSFNMEMYLNDTIPSAPQNITHEPHGAVSIYYLLAIGIILISIGNTKWSAKITGNALPGIARIRGNPFVGLLPYSCHHGLSLTLNLLYKVSEEQGLSYGWMGTKVLVLLRDEHMIRSILSQPDDVVSRTGGQRLMAPFSTLQRLLGNVLFLYVGEEATMMRNAMKAEYKHVSALQERYGEIVRTAQDHTEFLKSQQGNSKSMDLLQLTSDFSADALSRAYFGLEGTHTRDDGLEHIADRMLEVSASASHAWRHGLRSILRLRSPWHQDKEEKAIWESLDAISVQRLNDMYTAKKPDGITLTVAQSISLATGGGSSRATLSKHAIEQGRLTLFGGRFGIGIVLTWALLELSKNPTILERLRSEINNVYPASATEFPGFQTSTTQTPYLDAVLHEIHRLFPPVHATARVINKPIIFDARDKTPVKLEKGMIIYISIYHLHRDKTIWGEDADEFVPERFLHEQAPHKRSGYMPFLYGRRACVGREFSLLTEKIFMMQFLRAWEFDVEDKFEVGTKFTALCLPDREVRVTLEEVGGGCGES
ncbi:hypothetical protein FKW77_003509 [Venturia effusa]|uniref:U3 small nucleolar RNA-associated protein 10 n=1 Tax=Venturia effusa TaxID=50376 RepID=A0A517LPU8_9PEZI|nr:hypothetical protein FKW77_003509 [Venturia effusa]